jgi:DNA processing protein
MTIASPRAADGPLDGDERAAYLALTTVSGLGPARLAALRQACGSWNGALAAPFAFLCTVPAISRACATAIVHEARRGYDVMQRGLARTGAAVLVPGDAAFPAALAHVDPPVAALYWLGRRELLERPAIAVVGSRDHSADGAYAATQAAHAAAALGAVVVSGMARGLDAVAHLAALEAEAGTIGVLGNGIGVVYPAANRRLYERVAHDGLLVSELPPGERPHAGSFPRRNRLISGLATVTIVAEAGHESGALITARCALEQGRQVLVAPGAIANACCAGSNALLRDGGAGPFLDAGDVAAVFGDLLQAVQLSDAARAEWVRERRQSGAATRRASVELPPEPTAVLAQLGPSARPLEALMTATGLPLPNLLAALGHLDAVGLAEERGPQQWAARTARR